MSHNTYFHRIVRWAVRPLVGTAVTPNHITTLRLASGLGAAGLLAFGPPAWWNLAGLLFLVSLFLDRADGELARLGGSSSPWGHKYDLVADGVCNTVIFLALGLGLSGGPFGIWATVMGLASGLAVAAVLWLILRLEASHGARAGEISGTPGIDPDDAMVMVPLMIWLGLAEWLLIAAAIGAPVFAVFLFIKFRRQLTGART